MYIYSYILCSSRGSTCCSLQGVRRSHRGARGLSSMNKTLELGFDAAEEPSKSKQRTYPPNLKEFRV